MKKRLFDALLAVDDFAHRIPDPWHRWLVRWWLCGLVDFCCGMPLRDLLRGR